MLADFRIGQAGESSVPGAYKNFADFEKHASSKLKAIVSICKSCLANDDDNTLPYWDEERKVIVVQPEEMRRPAADAQHKLVLYVEYTKTLHLITSVCSVSDTRSSVQLTNSHLSEGTDPERYGKRGRRRV